MRIARAGLPVIAVITAASVVALAQAGYSFTVNGKKVPLEVVEKNGKVFVEANSAFKALGASVTYDKAKKSFVVVSAGRNQTQAVQGTAQLAGGEGVIGKTYTVGKGDDALNFTLKSVDYSVSRATVGTTVYVPKADEKLIVLHYTVQNPQNREVPFSYYSFKFTAVDARDTNHVFDNYIGREGSTDNLDMRLKPAQKIDAYAAWVVPASGVTPKLIVERGTGNPVLRYDLRGKTTKLAAPFADPADASGASALEEVPAEIGKFYPAQKFDIKLDSVAYSTNKILNKTPAANQRFLVATFTVKNATGKTAGEAPFSYSSFGIELRDADGDREKFEDYLVKASRDENHDGRLKPGEETRFRVFFSLPQDLDGKTLYIREGTSRTFAFDVSNIK
jgi:hypothetical protein